MRINSYYKKVGSLLFVVIVASVFLGFFPKQIKAQQAAPTTCPADKILIYDNAGGHCVSRDTANEAANNIYGVTDPSKITCDGFTNCAIVIVYWLGPGIATWALSISSYFMSIVVQLSLNSTAYALTFLTEGWVIVRDLANMAFIFILIYLALTIMFQADTAGTLKTLAVVIVVALLVNFSFFFTRVVIDTGNIIAVQFYNALPNYGLTGISGNIKDLGGSLMGAFQAQTLLSNSTFNVVYKATQQSSVSTVIVYSVVFLSMAAMMWTMFFAFIQVGIKFMLRIVALWLILIASPLAFVARTMPKTKTYFTRWLDMLIRFALYPAVFLFIFFILTKLTTNLVGTGGTGLFGSILNSTSPYSASTILGEGATLSITSVIASVAIRMGFIVALLYIGLKVSEWVVQEGSAVAAQMTGSGVGKVFGGIAVASRGSVRGLGLQNTWLGRQSFDLRNSRALTTTFGYLGARAIKNTPYVSPLDFGKDTSGQKAADRERRRKEREEDAWDRARVEDEIAADRARRATATSGGAGGPGGPTGGAGPSSGGSGGPGGPTGGAGPSSGGAGGAGTGGRGAGARPHSSGNGSSGGTSGSTRSTGSGGHTSGTYTHTDTNTSTGAHGTNTHTQPPPPPPPPPLDAAQFEQLNYYERLGVPVNADINTIKKAWRSLANKHHPDTGGNPDIMQLINEAYNTLKRPGTRASYNSRHRF